MEMNTRYNPNTLFIGSFKDSNLELLEEKYVEGRTMIYVCENKVCQLPTTEFKQVE